MRNANVLKKRSRILTFRIRERFALLMTLVFLAANLLPFQVLAVDSTMGVTDVKAVTRTSIEVTMPDISLAAGDFAIAGVTTNGAITVSGAAYSEPDGKYILSLDGAGISYYDTYRLTITKAAYESYEKNDLYYGTLATNTDLNLVNEPNMFDTYTRNYVDGTVEIVNDTYAADALICTGTALYTAIDTTNGLAAPAAVNAFKAVGAFVVPPPGAMGVKSLFSNGTMTKLEETDLIDGKPTTTGDGKTYYLETVADARAAHDNGTDPNNHYWETIAFAPVYMKTAVKVDADTWRLNDPDDRLRIIEWYSDATCTGTPIKVVRFMMTVEYTGDITKEVVANNSTELDTYLADNTVTKIDLLNGMTYTVTGSAITRDLTISGNGATIVAGTGVNDTVIRSDGTTVSSIALENYPGVKSFFTVGSGSELNLQNVTIRNGERKNGSDNTADGLFDVINVKTGGSLDMNNVALEGFHNNPENSNGSASGDNYCFGIHAEPGAVSTTIRNCTFSSSNAFRNAVAIRNGSFLIDRNTFEGTDYPIRLRQSDGYEYAMYIYGGNGTLSNNTATGYDNTTQPGYASAGIAVIGFYSTDVVIQNNVLDYNASGIDITRTWSPWSINTFMRVNGMQLTGSGIASESEIAYAMGEALKAANTQEYVSVSFDQNDEVRLTNTSTPVYYAVYGGYRSPMLTASRVSENRVVLQLPATEADGLRAADSIAFEQQTDGSATWTPLSVSWLENPTKAAITLSTGHNYKIRMKMIHTSYAEPGDLIARTLITYSNPVTLSMTGTPVTPVQSAPTASTNGAEVLVNGKAETAGTATTTVKAGKTVVTITVDPLKLAQKLESEGDRAVVTIQSGLSPDTLIGELTGDMIKGMEARGSILELKTGTVSYKLPALQVNMTEIAEKLDTQAELKDIRIQVGISEPSAETVKIVEDSANKGNFTLVVPPIEFTVTGVYKDRTIAVTTYTAYVERTIAIPDGVDPLKITTGIVVEPDGTVRHVPTQIIVVGGKYFAKISSLSNSTYSVVWHPVEFSDVATHWAKEAVNDMGSRMVTGGGGDGRFEPDKAITRADFAVMAVKALGLKPGTGKMPFTDIRSTDTYVPYIETAAQYGIVTGYEDGTYRPESPISREQAMAMISRAMKITGLGAGLDAGETVKLLAGFKDTPQSAQWARNSIAACLKAGLVDGRYTGLLAPKKEITRAETAVIIRRLLQKSHLI